LPARGIKVFVIMEFPYPLAPEGDVDAAEDGLTAADGVADTDGLTAADGVADADGLTEADAVAEAEAVAEADELDDADAVADVDVDERTDGDADTLADADVPGPDDALADDETPEDAEEADALPEADAVREETCAAGDGAGVAGCPVKAVTANPAIDTATIKPMTNASTSGRHLRRARTASPAGTASRAGTASPAGTAPPGGGSVVPGTGMFFDVVVGELSAREARSWLSPVAARPGAVVRVCAPPAKARMIDSGSQSDVGWRAPTWASKSSAVGR
jgi:hypothetical protein